MAKSDLLRKQHQDLLGVVGQLTALLNPASVAAKAADIRTILTKMKGGVEMHLNMEDKTIYPQMLASPAGKAIAEKFQKEMGGIATVFMAYMTKYSTPAAISANAAAFITETNGLLKALGNRITSEEKDLYPVFDKT